MSRKVNYFESENIAPEDYTTVIGCFPVRYVPLLISAIETRKARSFWTSDTDYIRGNQVLNEVQIMLLTGCCDGIINNIIALRGISPTAPRDPETNTPLAPETGTTLLDIYAGIQTVSGTENVLLERIAEATEATEAGVNEGFGIGNPDGVFLAQLLGII